MGLIRLAELNFDFISALGFAVLAEQVKATRVGLRSFLVLQNEVAQPKQGGIFGDTFLDPALIELGMVGESK
jgi:hypothetical protein